MFPFSEDVIQFIVLLTQNGNADTVRDAIRADPAVMQFATPGVGGRNGALQGVGDAEDPLAQSAFFTLDAPYVAICEAAEGDGGEDGLDDETPLQMGQGKRPQQAVAAPSQIIATTDLNAVFKRMSFNNEAMEATGGAMDLAGTMRGLAATRRGPADLAQEVQPKPLSCVLIKKRDPSAVVRGSLTVRDLYIQSMDMRRPLDALQGLLRNVYDPMLRAQKSQTGLRAHVQDLLTGIRSMHHVLQEIDITRYVQEELLELCDANPQLDVPELIGRLGETATDPSFIRKVLQTRNRCNEVLSMESLLSGKKEEEEEARKKQKNSNSSASGDPSVASGGISVSGIPGTAASGAETYEGQDDDSVWVIQDKIVYWQCVLSWLEDVLKKLRFREWRLVHRLLGSRVETDYVSEYVGYCHTVRDYIKFLSTIPEKHLLSVEDMSGFNRVVDDIFTALMAPSKYPPRLLLSLLRALTSQMAWRWVSVTEAERILTLDDDEDSAQTVPTAQNILLSPAAMSDPLTPLRTLRNVLTALQRLQAAYVEHSTALRKAAGVIRPTKGSPDHPRVAALSARCMSVRELMEGHMLLMHQLGSVVSVQSRLGVISSSTSAMSAQHRAGEEFATMLQKAYNECVCTVCGLEDPEDESTLMGETMRKRRRVHRENFLWRTTPTAQQRFVAAIQMYYQQRSRCDERLATLLAQMLTNAQAVSPQDQTGKGKNASSAAHKSEMDAVSDAQGLRLFRVFKNFRFLPLEKVQRVVQGYQGPVSEKLSNYVKAVEESYVDMHVTKREVSYNVTRYRTSTLVAQIMWEQHLETALTEAIIRFDYVSPHGWHQLLHLRNIECYWRLNTSLAEFIGASLDDLVTADLHRDSEVHGCAVALAYLDIFFAEATGEWGADPDIHYAQELIAAKDPNALASARDRLLLIGTVKPHKAEARVRDIRSSRAIIRGRIEEKVAAWYTEVSRIVMSSPSDKQTLLLSSPVLRAIPCGSGAGGQGVNTSASGAGNAGDNEASQTALSYGRSVSQHGRGGHGHASPGDVSFGNNTSSIAAAFPTGPSAWMVDAAFPWSFSTIAEDLRYLEGAQLLGLVEAAANGTIVAAGAAGERRRSTLGQSVSRSASPRKRAVGEGGLVSLSLLRDSMRGNETRARLALCLVELIRLYYITVNGEDESLVLLATDEYEAVNRLFQRGFALRWCDEGLAAYFQSLSDVMQNFVETVEQVRVKTEAVYKKIKAFSVRPFHPEAIVQRVKGIGRIADALALRCVHAHLWVKRTQPLLEQALVTQIKFLLRSWTEDFVSMKDDLRFLEKGTETDVFRLTPLRVHMRVVYKEVRLDSPAAAWRGHWIDELNRFLEWVGVLPRLYKAEDEVTGEEGMALNDGGGVLQSTSNLFSSFSRGGGMMHSASPRVTDSAASYARGGRSGAGSDGVDGGIGGNDPVGSKGYAYLLLRVPPTALAEPLKVIEQCVQEAIQTENEWRRSQQFLNLDVNLMQQRFGTDLRRWSSALQLMHTITSKIMDYTQPNKLLGGIVIVAEDAQIELGRKLDQVGHYTHAKFKGILQGELETTFRTTTQERVKIDGLDVISNVKDAAEFLSEAPRLQKELEVRDPYIALMADAEASLQALGHVLPEHWIYASGVREEFNSLKELVDRKLKAVQLRRPYLLDEAKSRADALDKKIKELDRRFRSMDGDATKSSPAIAQQMVNGIYDEAVALEEEGKRLAAIQDALGETPRAYPTLQQLLADAKDLKDVWGHVANAYAQLNELAAMPFFEMVPRRLQQQLQQIEADTEAYPEAVHSFQLYQELVQQVRRVLGYHRYMQDLRSDAMSPLQRAQRHWNALKQRLGVPWVLNELTVKNVWDSDPTGNAVIYNEIIDLAQGERRIESQLQEINEFWDTFEFSITIYKKQVGLVRGWDDVFARLTEDLSTFGGIRASPYFISPQLVSLTNESEARLDRLRQVLEALLEVQKRWVYLDGIFSGNTEVRAQLPQDTMKFDRTSRELMHILPRPHASGELPPVRAAFFLGDEKLLPTLERLLAQLIAVQRALTTYLDTQRSRFPRFFFIGDDDLLEIMGNSKNPLFLNKHLKKMFTALASLQLDGDLKAANTRVKGFSSAEGEEVKFLPGPIEFRQRPIYEWLTEAEQGMVHTLRECTVRAFRELSGNADGTQGAVMTPAWIASHPAQVVCLTLQLLWVKWQEDVLSSGQAPASPKASPVVLAMDTFLASLASAVLDTNIQPDLRHRCEQLITVAVYQRDCSRQLAQRGVSSAEDFDWLSIFRLYVVASNKVPAAQAATISPQHRSANVVECRMADAALVHGFEYVGMCERLVQTPLTDKCYLTLMQALHTRFGGSPVGPAGTGKTETVKALGMQMGRHVLVFNCDDTFDYQAVSRIFLGLCQVGAWGCFDEFNRLEERILSALSLQIQCIQESLRSRQDQIALNNHSVPLHTNVAIFVTMNPGYAGRSKLPGNLKQLFRTVTMTVPDRETIAEVMLFAQGFHTAEALSQKVVPLFRLCEDQFTKQAHYDFGLRALKSVLVAAGDRKRQVAAVNNKPAAPQSREQADEECTILLESIIATIAPKLVTQDVALFYPLLHDFFPGRELPSLPMEDLREAVCEICAESGLSPAAGWVEKVLQLYHTKNTRHGVMVVGPSGTGKTTAWKVLMSAMARLDPRLEMHGYVVGPKILNKSQLFGTLDITTREWKDGVLTSILRRIIDAEEQMQIPDDIALAGNEDITEQQTPLPASKQAGAAKKSAARRGGRGAANEEAQQKEHWIIFDGDVDPEWVENLNSVLDDNRLLTLPNGERLPLPKSVHILFEVQDLKFATPATVSRCGMLWFSEGVVPLASILAYAYQRLQDAPVVDVRGRRVHWHLEEDMIGIANAWQAPHLSDATVSGSYGKAYHEYVVSGASANVEAILGSSRKGSADRPLGDTFEETLSAAVTPKRGVGAKDAQELSPSPLPTAVTGDLAATMYGTASVPMQLTQRGHPDAERIRDAMVSAWAGAFEVGGVVMRAINLLRSPTSGYREVCIMEVDLLQTIQSMLAFLANGVWRAFEAEQSNSGSAFAAATLQKIAARVMDYAVFWGVASGMNFDNRNKLAKDLGLKVTVAGNPQSIVDVEVDYATGEWRLIKDRVGVTTILAEQVGANDTVIPTVDTRRHEEMLSGWLGAGRSAILCGPPGSGKTMSITAVLNSLPEYEVVFLNFSSGTTVDIIMKTLEQYCHVRDTARGLVMAPASGRKLLLFCDEINLPALDKYGTQVVVQLLRQLIERRGFYRSRDNTWVTVEDIQVVGACNPPTDPGRVPLSLRFLRWAPVLLVDFPSPDSLLTIYTTYCRAILSWSSRLSQEAANPLAQAMVKMYRASQQKFTPIQQPHYLYSPRELSRWSRALFEGMQTWDEAERKQSDVGGLVRLALHEGLRVFADRLVSAEERRWTDGTIDASFKQFFPNLPPKVYARPLLYSTLLSRNYTDSSREELRAYVQKRLVNFNEEETLGDLVVYDGMLDHIVRIDRVLRQPLGHMLIAGASGVGKTILTRLVAWMRGFETFFLKVHREYDLANFEDDLRSLLRRSGCRRERICFLFDESNILQPAFLEYMNALLASGEVPGLFEGEEWPKLMQDIRDAVLQSQTYNTRSGAAGGGGGGKKSKKGGPGASGTGEPLLKMDVNEDDKVDVSSESALYHWFLNNVREYLHVVLTINPSSGEFTSRTVASPALVNRCTIDWFGDWDYETLQQVADERIRKLELLAACHGTFASEKEAHSAVVEALCSIHHLTQEVNTALRVRHANQGTFISPRHFSDSVSHFVEVFKDKQNASSSAAEHLRNGLKKLQETSQEVAAQQATLRDSEAEIEENSRRAQKMLDRIVSETEAAKKDKEAAEHLETQLTQEHSDISEEAKRVFEELGAAEPALREAENALATVKPEYLREIRAYTTPPPMVKRVLEAVTALMGEKKSEDWDVLKGYIRRDDFLTSVREFKPDRITLASRDRVMIMMKDKKNFSVDAAYRASKAAGPLLQWVFAQVQYSGIFMRVAPMRAEIDKLTAARDVKLKALEKAQVAVREKETLLNQLKSEYQQAQAKISDLKQKISTVSVKCERASKVVQQLIEERKRWELEVRNSDSEARTTLGDCLLSSVFLSYVGFFDEYTRQSVLVPRWMSCLQKATIVVRDGLSVTEYLTPPSQLLGWEQAGLPKDRLCLDNATIMQRSQRFTLLIDPTGTAAAFLQKYYASKKISKASFTRSGYLKQLEMAVRFGYPIVMEDAEQIDPAVGALLNGEVRRHGSRFITRIGPHEVDLAPTFRLFLHTRNPNYQPPPDLAGQVCVVNFTVTLSSLQSQCLHEMLSHERPDVDTKRTRLLKMQGEYQLKLRVLEEKLLTLIAEAEGSLLDNDALVQTLTQLKEESSTIAMDISGSESALREIRAVEAQYRPVATVVAQIYFALKRFSELSGFYRYDERFIGRVLGDALAALPPRATSEGMGSEKEEGQRIHSLAYNVFVLAHRRVARGLFGEDQLVWELRLAQLRSSMAPIHPATTNGASITVEEWDWIMSGLRMEGGAGKMGHSAASEAADDGGAGLPPIVRKSCPGLGKQSRQGLTALLQKPAFKEVKQSLATQAPAWEAVLTSATPVQASASALPPNCFPTNADDTRKLFLLTLVLLYTRRDAFAVAAQQMLHLFFSLSAMQRALPPSVQSAPPKQIGDFYTVNANDLDEVLAELSPAIPLLLVADTMYDPASRVEEMARRVGAALHITAMGSSESVESAEQYFAQCATSGGWVLLKNVHLAKAYMEALEKQLHFYESENSLHPKFRLIMTAERDAAAGAAKTPVLPINLLAVSVMVVYEAPPGIQSSLAQTYGQLSKYSEVEGGDGDVMQRLYLAAAWLHSVITERVLYKPLGWSEVYEYTDVEYRRVVQALHAWTDAKSAASASNAAALAVAWKALRRIVSITIYGGKVSNLFDQHILDTFCRRLLDTAMLKDGAQLVPECPAASQLPPPVKGGNRAALMEWLGSLPEGGSNPAWLGLPLGADRMTRARSALETVERLSLVQTLLDEELAAIVGEAKTGKGGAAAVVVAPAAAEELHHTKWAAKIHGYCISWHESLKNGLAQLERDPFVTRAVAAHDAENLAEEEAELILSSSANARSPASGAVPPLVLAIQREAVAAVLLFRHLHTDVRELQEVVQEERKPSSVHRRLVEELVKDRVPAAWAAHLRGVQGAASQSLFVGSWVADVLQRLEHTLALTVAAEGNRVAKTRVNLGLLFAPGAFITAFKQHSARSQRVPLEQLVPAVQLVAESGTAARDKLIVSKSEDEIVFGGLHLCSATVQASGQCQLADSQGAAPSGSAPLTVPVSLRWSWMRASAVSGSGTSTTPAALQPLANRLALQAATRNCSTLVTPLYTTENREALLEIVELNVEAAKSGDGVDAWYERGVCLAAWTSME